MNQPLATETFGFIGGGNMAHSLVGGLIARGHPARQIVVADPVQAQLAAFSAQYGVQVTTQNVAAATAAEILVLAVKPQEMRNVAAELRSALGQRRPLLVSVAAGIRASDIQEWLDGIAVVRCMPNRPALQGVGITALYATGDVSSAQRARAEAMLSAVGATLWLERESDMDAVTAISGSGPAYFFLLIEILEQAGVALGLSSAVSRKLAVETAYGSGAMAHDSTETPATLRQQVTSRGGTTEAALQVLEARAVREIFTDAVAAAARRSAQLADQFGGRETR